MLRAILVVIYLITNIDASSAKGECMTCSSFEAITNLASDYVPIAKEMSAYNPNGMKQTKFTMEMVKDIFDIEGTVSSFSLGPCHKKNAVVKGPYNIHNVFEFNYDSVNLLAEALSSCKAKNDLDQILKRASLLKVKDKLELVEKLFKDPKAPSLKCLLKYLNVKNKKPSLKYFANTKAKFLQKIGVYDINFVSHIDISGLPAISLVVGTGGKHGVYNGKIYPVSHLGSLYGKQSKVYDVNWKQDFVVELMLLDMIYNNHSRDINSLIFHGADGIDYHWLVNEEEHNGKVDILISLISDNEISDQDQVKLKRYLDEEYVYKNQIGTDETPKISFGVSKSITDSVGGDLKNIGNDVYNVAISKNKYRGDVGLELMALDGKSFEVTAGLGAEFKYGSDELSVDSANRSPVNYKYAVVDGTLKSKDSTPVLKAIYEAGSIVDSAIFEATYRDDKKIPIEIDVGHRYDRVKDGKFDIFTERGHKSFVRFILPLKEYVNVSGDLVMEFNHIDNNNDEGSKLKNAGFVYLKFSNH